MFNSIRNNVTAVIGNRFNVSEIAKEEEYFVFGIFGGQYDYLIITLDGNTVVINNGDGHIELRYDINDENVADIIVRLMCELNLTFL